MDNQQLNNLVIRYQSERSDEVFAEIYAEVTKGWRSLATVAKSLRASEAETLAAYEDVLMRCLETYDGRGDFINFLNMNIKWKRKDIYGMTKRRKEFEVYEKANDDEAATSRFEIADEFNLEETVIAKKKADQLALIDSLLEGADEITIGVVRTFLNHPKPTATAIAKELGVHHSKVIRTLNRLAGKFSTKQHGDFRDYLVAL
ncbi:hypothetical protein [Peribacillus frigoritolerans]|uniref:hypothetical protein n=2 Tax=Peribacillus frigoritolerans TaxID=450367 RepID=UPI002E200098|nr:hypothetical protein [Peribacillus frigoritolerans]